MWGKAADAKTVTGVLFDLVKPGYFRPMVRPDLQSRRLCHMSKDGERNADRVAKAKVRFQGLFEGPEKTVRCFIDEFVALVRG
jgi:hypothetical protein